MSWYHEAFGPHYRLLYSHRDEAEAQRVVGALDRLAPLAPGPVLDLGCGDGRHLPALAALGVGAVGLDLSPPLLAMAARRRPAAHFDLLRADMRWPPLRPGSCGAVLSLFTAFGYFGRLADHRPLVAQIASLLRAGGHWFLDHLDCEAVRRELAAGPVERERNAGGLLIRERRRLSEGADRVLKDVELARQPGGEPEQIGWEVPEEGLRYREEVALFTLPEIDDLAAGSGLVRVAAAGGYGGEPLRAGRSERWLLVYRRSGREAAP